jgi:hypothetical protein
VTFTENVVNVTEEVLLYDDNVIISAVGGSLILFLGFLCYDLKKRGANRR